MITTDPAPQPGQTITSVTATASYDDLGRVTSTNDPDRGTHTYTYDNDGHVLSDVSGSRTIGANYDLLGRVGCVQDAIPIINATGACTSGSHPFVQNTYDTTVLGTQGTSDFPVGELTQSIATTSYPDGSTATVTEQAQHDKRGRVVAGHLQLSWPGSWGVTNPLPTYQLAASYNDADQLTTTTTSTNPAGQGSTSTNVYDSTTGALVGLGNTGSASANVASLTFTPHALINTITFQTTSSTGLALEQFSYDANLRPTRAGSVAAAPAARFSPRAAAMTPPATSPASRRSSQACRERATREAARCRTSATTSRTNWCGRATATASRGRATAPVARAHCSTG